MSDRRLAAGLACVATLACGGHRAPVGEVGPARAEAAVAAQQPVTELAALRTEIDSLVRDPRFRSAIWGILIVDPDAGDTLYSLNAGKLFMPASNMKIVTGTTALVTLGPDFQYRTTYAIHGRLRRGVVDGDLVVIGRGDPTVSDHMAHSASVPLRAAADSLAAHGIRRITGRIISGGDAFPDANLGYGWDWDDLNEPYAAGVDELMLNEGYTTVVVHGGARAGAAATIATSPAATYPALRNHVRTIVPTGDAPAPAITVAYDSLTWALVIGGSIAPRDSATALVAYRSPAAAYLHALATAVAARGIRLRAHAADFPTDVPTDGAAPATTAAGAPLDTVFTMLSPPLRDILPALLKPSQNQIA
jgi:serine-type D-Ala-D-Ala carboxypeptidase/endopeptidase (penicillin-binding protein 4)